MLSVLNLVSSELAAPLQLGCMNPGASVAGAEVNNPGYKEYSQTDNGVLFEDVRIGEVTAVLVEHISLTPC